jgi:hypothetical protein
VRRPIGQESQSELSRKSHKSCHSVILVIPTRAKATRRKGSPQKGSCQRPSGVRVERDSEGGGVVREQWPTEARVLPQSGVDELRQTESASGATAAEAPVLSRTLPKISQ